MIHFQSWGVNTTFDMLQAIRELIISPDTYYDGVGPACDKDGRVVKGHDPTACKWSPIGAWQCIAHGMWQQISTLRVILRVQKLMNEAAFEMSEGRFNDISNFNNNHSRGCVVAALDMAIKKAKADTGDCGTFTTQ